MIALALTVLMTTISQANQRFFQNILMVRGMAPNG